MKKLLILLILVISLKVTGATYYVATTGNDSYTKVQAQNPATPWLTIQKGADEAVAGDTVIVKDGTYTATSSTMTVIYVSGTAANPVTFKSENEHGAVLDGSGNDICFAIVASNIVFDGFEIKSFNGSGFTLNNTTTPKRRNITIKNCHIHNMGNICSNSAYGMGGIFLKGVNNVNIEGNIFNDIGRYASGESGCTPTNSYYMNHDHGIYVVNIDTINIQNNVFYNNNNGWSVHFADPPYSKVKIYNNTFDYGNHWGSSGAYGSHIIITSMSDAEITNNIFNDCEDEAIFLYNSPVFSNVLINYNIAYGGAGKMIQASLPYSGTLTVENNLENTDPLMTDRASYDFTLTQYSPCINTGTDVGLPYDGAAPDMGAFEYSQGDPPNDPTVIITNKPYWTSNTTASSSGNVLSDGGGTVSARGVCWNTTGSPTIADSKTEDGTGDGVFTSTITGVTRGITYYVRAYATNEIGTSYGTQYVLRAGKIYLFHGGKILTHNGKILFID